MATSNQIILVTGATGNQGGAVARHLLQRGVFAVRALANSAESPRRPVRAAMGWIAG